MFHCISRRNVSSRNQLEAISLSTTVAQGVEGTGGNISSQLKNKVNDFEWFFSALGESTDVADTVQLLPSIGGVSAKYEAKN